MRALARPALLALIAAAPTSALAHGGAHDPLAPFGWTWDPAIVFPLFLALLLFATGWGRLHARSKRGTRGLRRRAVLFGLGWAILAGALVSPLHQGGEHSFALHMIEHELLMLAAAPLLVLSRPLAIILWAWPAPARHFLGRASVWPAVATVWRCLTKPITATLLQAAALWLWHMPTLFDLALAHDRWHVAQHLSFIISALLFWTATLDNDGAPAQRAVSAMCLFATSVVSGALGALMAMSTSPWYQGYARLGLAPLGLTPAEDQQIAGLIMWVPGGLVHAMAALVLIRGLLSSRGSEGRFHAV